LAEFRIRGWELVVANVSPGALERLRRIATRVTEISTGRYTVELPLSETPEQMIPAVVDSGASIISLNPLQDTLEDFFVQRVAEAGAGARAESAEGGDARR
jgi:hypothetical protein